MVADKEENNEQLDADILQCKKDVLRASDIIPGLPKPNDSSRQKSPKTPEAAGKTPETADIPRFDLAEKILAEQRKIGAARRKAPSQQSLTGQPKPKAEPLKWVFPERDSIITEIVARDIRLLQQGIWPK